MNNLPAEKVSPMHPDKIADSVDEQSYDDCVREAHEFIRENYGSFEKLAEWGLF